MKKLFWRIRGHDGFKSIFDMTVGLGQFTDDQIQHLLQALAVKGESDYAKIVGAYARRKTKIANDLLAVQKDFNYPTYTCGCDPHFSASVVGADGKILVSKKGAR
jgi:hypothetical protein